MGWAMRDSIPGRGKRFFSSIKPPDQHWGPPSLLFNEYTGSFSGGKVAEV
jgi:hypothetical protein